MELVKLFKLITLANEEFAAYTDKNAGFISAGVGHDEEFNIVPQLHFTEEVFAEVAAKLALTVRANGHCLTAKFAGVQIICMRRERNDD